jgi:hypothetical protein
MAEILFVSLIHLIQHPELYAEKPVRVIGYASLEFEGKALYIHEEDYRNSVTKNGIWLEVPLNDATRKLHERFVLVEGVFDPSAHGHLGMYSGTLKDVTRLELWSDPRATTPRAAKP